MLVILASRYDQTAHVLADQLAAFDAHVLTCEDLSTAGWRHELGRSDGTAVIGGELVATSDVRGVLVRLPSISEWELPHIVAADRGYVASEMNAFLRCWLAGLPCPMLNRPTPTSLAGPNWRPERWIHTAARLGIPVCPITRSTIQVTPDSAVAWPASTSRVTVVGEQCFGLVVDELARRAKSLAIASDVELLHVAFTGAEADAQLLGADPWPPLDTAEIVEAIGAYLGRGSA